MFLQCIYTKTAMYGMVHNAITYLTGAIPCMDVEFKNTTAVCIELRENRS